MLRLYCERYTPEARDGLLASADKHRESVRFHLETLRRAGINADIRPEERAARIRRDVRTSEAPVINVSAHRTALNSQRIFVTHSAQSREDHPAEQPPPEEPLPPEEPGLTPMASD